MPFDVGSAVLDAALYTSVRLPRSCGAAGDLPAPQVRTIPYLRSRSLLSLDVQKGLSRRCGIAAYRRGELPLVEPRPMRDEHILPAASWFDESLHDEELHHILQTRPESAPADREMELPEFPPRVSVMLLMWVPGATTGRGR